jgi:protein-L-isoaspartate O-methyltransferase
MLTINTPIVRNKKQQLNHNINFYSGHPADKVYPGSINNTTLPNFPLSAYYSYINFNPVSFKALDNIVKEAVNGHIIGKTFIPTPEYLIDIMIKKAEIKAGDRILEPSAGQGHIVEKLMQSSSDITIDAVEINKILQNSLRERNINLVGEDILKYKPEEPYNKILMNPPFENLLFANHIIYCYKNLLKSGGKLITVVPDRPFKLFEEGVFTKIFKKREHLSQFMDLTQMIENKQICHEFTKLQRGLFTQSDVPSNVNTRLLVFEKPAATKF